MLSSPLSSQIEKPTFKEAFLFWLKLGFISFGGPAGQIAIMHEFLVDKKKWISDARFLHALNYCMILPGPEAQQLAIYIGWLLHGVKGGVVAGVLFVLPSVFILLGLSIVYVSFGTLPWVYALFYGLKPAVVAIVILALIKIGKKSLLTAFHFGIALLSFVAIYFFNVAFPLIIISAILVAWIGSKIYPKLLESKQSEAKQAADEHTYYLNILGTGATHASTTWKLGSLLKQLSVFVLLWLLPIICFYFFSNGFDFWRDLSLFFTKAAFVTVGGAYAVLPYVAQVSVEKFDWLSRYEMIDGLALGETTPGPLIMVLAFVGFMAGYNQFQNAIWAGTLGLLTTTFYTFLPCFLFIFLGAPIIERTQHSTQIKGLMSTITAAVVGVILNLTLYFGQAVVFPKQISFQSLDYFSLLWIVVSFLVMYRFKLNMILWIGISAIAGLIYYMLFK